MSWSLALLFWWWSMASLALLFWYGVIGQLWYGVIGQLVRWFSARVPPFGPSEEKLLDGRKLRDWFTVRQCCPDCGCSTFLDGPSGGCSQNVMCSQCSSKFNLALPLAAHRI